ncbi:peptide receptor gpcr [Plakobranchus ocellatus]|uniref:Peptide receptor gpcr n=1 Tax=Plakobranchus ocellatus TaxID=259542 RepID=A0AAV4CG34_9GAST|nr:peptide receptor gpcr [Plakobranchus ocellatus]
MKVVVAAVIGQLMFGLRLTASLGFATPDPNKEDNNSSALLIKNATSPDVANHQNSIEWFAQDAFFNAMPILTWAIVVIGVLGVVGNIFIIHVYIRLGFSETIHMSYLALAVSDLCGVLAPMWIKVCYSSLIHTIFKGFQIGTDLTLFTNLTGYWPHFAFSRTTALITAWISVERCLCVVFPLTIKRIITRSVTKLVLAMIFIIGCGPTMFPYIACRPEWRFDPLRNQTSFYILPDCIEGVDPLLRFALLVYGVVYPVFSNATVTVSTVFLIIKLRQSAARTKRNINAPTDDRPTIPSLQIVERKVSARTTRLTKTVIIVAVVFIICSLPMSLSVFWGLSVRGYSPNGDLRYLLKLNALIIVVFSVLNSSVNVIIFTVMGSRFRATLLGIFCRK